MSNELDLEELNGLSEEERRAVLSILRDISKEGKSKKLDDIKYQDYKEIPVDIETFITDDRYMGQAWKDSEGKLKIFPFWMNKLKELFPNNLDTKVNTFIASGARGLGKSEICIAIMCYMLHRVMCLKNPLEHFRLKPSEKIVFALVNIKLALAEEIAISKFQNSIRFSPWFLDRGYYTGRTTKIWQPNDEYNIDIKIGSQSDDLIGLPVLFLFADEVSFQRNQDIEKQKQKAIDIIDTGLGGMITRYTYAGKRPTMLCLASSKRSEKSFLEEHIKIKLQSEPDNVMVVDEPVWNVRPEKEFSKDRFRVAVGNKFLTSTILNEEDKNEDYYLKGYTKILNVPSNLKAQFIDNMDRALCDYAGISSTELSKYISGSALKDCINNSIENIFSREIIEVGNAKDDTAEYKDFVDLSKIDRSLMSKPLFIHLDMSLSGDKTGIAGVWIKGKKPTTDGNPGKDLFYRVAFAVAIKAPKGRQISLAKNRNFIRWLKEQGFRIKHITSDSFQSADLLQQMTAEGYDCSVLSVDRVDTDRVCKPYAYFKNTIYEQRIEMGHNSLVEQEIVNLERNVNTGKVDHPENGSKDTSDAICGATFKASQYAEEFAYDYGETTDEIFEANKTESDILRKQLTVDFEEELKKSFKPKDVDPFMDFGMGKAQPITSADILII